MSFLVPNLHISANTDPKHWSLSLSGDNPPSTFSTSSLLLASTAALATGLGLGFGFAHYQLRQQHLSSLHLRKRSPIHDKYGASSSAPQEEDGPLWIPDDNSLLLTLGADDCEAMHSSLNAAALGKLPLGHTARRELFLLRKDSGRAATAMERAAETAAQFRGESTNPSSTSSSSSTTIDPSTPLPSLFLNHGSYGTVPIPVFQRHQHLLTRVETHPDLWFRLHSWPITRASIKPFAALLNTDPTNLVFVNNATAAVTAVLQSIQTSHKLSANDLIITPNTTYGACKLVMQAIADRSGCQYAEIEIKLPVASDQEIMNQVEAEFKRIEKTYPRKKIRFALFDLITSPAALVVPYKQVAAFCRQRNVLCMIDAAHAAGQLPVDLSSFQCDYFTCNLHKWLFAPKGCALLYVHPSLSSTVQPVVISHHHYSTDWTRRFWMQATREDTAYIASVEGFNLMTALGWERVREYNEKLADEAVEYLSRLWGTTPNPLYPRSMAAPYLRLVELPSSVRPPANLTTQAEFFRWGDTLLLTLLREFDIVVATLCYGGKIYVRLSAQIYNELSDYKRLGEAVLLFGKIGMEHVPPKEIGEK